MYFSHYHETPTTVFGVLSEKPVKTIKMQRLHAQGICVILFVILLINFTITVSVAREFLDNSS